MDRHEVAVMRGEAAQRIVNDPLFDAAFGAVRTAIVQQWEQLPTTDTENARDLHRRLKCLADVRTALEAHITTGKFAQKELSLREKAAQVTRNAFSSMTRSNGSR